MTSANDNSLPDRVLRLEASVQSIGDDLADVRRGQDVLGAKIDRLVDGLTSTDGRAAERAQAVKTEIRDETARKAGERSDLFKTGLAMVGAIAVIVAALGGPYVAKLDGLSATLRENSQALGQVRELLAADRAEISRNRDSIEIARDRGGRHAEQLLDLSQRLARIEGAR